MLDLGAWFDRIIEARAPQEPIWQWIGLVWKWPRIVGPAVARYATPVQWTQGRLVVELSHPAWLAEMRQNLELLRTNVRKHCPWGPVQTVELRLRRHRSRSSSLVPPLRPVQIPPDVEVGLRRAAAFIPDPQVRRRFLQACRAHWRLRLASPSGKGMA